VRLAHERAGSGEPLLLIHGLGGDRCVWEPVLDTLSETHDVISVDLPGFGGSQPLDEDPTPRALARAVAAFLDELGLDTAHVAGNSLGGWVALELAAAGRARSVAGICPAGLWRQPTLGPGETARSRGHRAARLLRPLIPVVMLSRAVRRLVLSPFVADPDRVPYRAAWRMISAYARATAFEATSTAMRRGRFSGRVPVPVTLAFGELDRLIRPTATAVPGARTLVLPGCGHIAMWDAPDLVVEAIVGAPAALAAAAAG
jgi:pimeloyl-ACP methyl ester carboxylesterase